MINADERILLKTVSVLITYYNQTDNNRYKLPHFTASICT
jgi:hypothetical protein